MLDQFLTTVADWLLLIAGLGAVVFTASYAVFFRWRKTAAGRALMYFVLSLDGLFLLNILGRWIGPDYPGRIPIRLAVYTAVLLTIWRLVFVLWRGWRSDTDRPLELEKRTKE